MSVSVDDLVSSFSSSHIGQEAIDLAALQAQLAQTLFGQSISQPSTAQNAPRRASYTQPCNTPTVSSSFDAGQHMVEAQQQVSAASPSGWGVERTASDGDEMEQDERMVEDLLVPSSPISANPSISHFSLPHPSSAPIPQLDTQKYCPSRPHATSFSQQTAEPCTSLFTSVDPFYIAQFQAAQNYNALSNSAFSQFGRPAQHSPFAVQQQPLPREGCVNANSPLLPLDRHSLFVTTSAAFGH